MSRRQYSASYREYQYLTSMGTHWITRVQRSRRRKPGCDHQNQPLRGFGYGGQMRRRQTTHPDIQAVPMKQRVVESAPQGRRKRQEGPFYRRAGLANPSSIWKTCNRVSTSQQHVARGIRCHVFEDPKSSPPRCVREVTEIARPEDTHEDPQINYRALSTGGDSRASTRGLKRTVGRRRRDASRAH